MMDKATELKQLIDDVQKSAACLSLMNNINYAHKDPSEQTHFTKTDLKNMKNTGKMTLDCGYKIQKFADVLIRDSREILAMADIVERLHLYEE